MAPAATLAVRGAGELFNMMAGVTLFHIRIAASSCLN